MIYELSLYLKSHLSLFNIMHYTSVRAIGGLLSTLAFSLIFGGFFVEASSRFLRARARENTPQHHQAKGSVPTMGGLFIVFVSVLNIILWCNWAQPRVWIFIAGFIGFAAIGCWDDVSKIMTRRGIAARTKFILQVAVALLVVLSWIFYSGSTEISLPIFKNLTWDAQWFFIPYAIFIMVGASNAVNLTDGLDGLAIGSLLPNFATFALISYLAGHALISLYLHIPFAHSAELAVISAILVGASLGFLWFNAYPAQIFMGDVGSLSLGAALAMIALMCKQEMLLPISGGLFVLETVSVIVQVISYRLFGKRVFRMAPIHHHFELSGWQEAKITTRFGIISCVLCLCALILLKVR